MRFETLNSMYQVDVTDGGKFKVTKIEELRESTFNAVGVPRISESMRLQVGARAFFDTWSTSRVVRIVADEAKGATKS